MKMKFKKMITNVGDSLGIIFTRSDRKVMNLEKGDILDLSDSILIKKRKEK